ncbi:Cytochrome O ubiquinol oxidase subunit III [Polaromonas sp. CG9_12]|nr:Cytochrome O ubiquinol oxidase subunit III [Polaromonas sp. CG9_12]
MFGFWVFLMSDAVLFSLLLATYGVMLPGTAGGPVPSEIFELRSAFVQTLILLFSSFSFGMASLAMKYQHSQKLLVIWLVLTLVLGLAFLAMEGRDFSTLFEIGAVPSRSGFLSAFFALLSTHGLHVAAGCIWIVVLMAQLKVFGRDTGVKTNLLRLGLFWHFLDIIWIAIFSVVYLQGLIR